MIKEIGHFIRNGKELNKLQRQHSRAEFADILATKVDEQGYAEIRSELVGDLVGRVLEIGCGTGAMFPYYAESARVEAIEPEEDFLAFAVRKAANRENIRAGSGNGMKLEYTDGSFDAVVLGLVLCSVPSVKNVLAEAVRVLRPGGHLRALEHVRSAAALPGFLMDLTNPLWLKLNKQGCCWNRNPLGEMREAGFELDDVMSFKRFDTCMPAFQMRRVKAHKP